MKITIYCHPQINPSTLSQQIKTLVERETGKPCIVKFSG